MYFSKKKFIKTGFCMELYKTHGLWGPRRMVGVQDPNWGMWYINNTPPRKACFNVTHSQPVCLIAYVSTH